MTVELNDLGYKRETEDIDAQKQLVLLTDKYSRALVTMMYGMDEHVSSVEKEVGTILNQQLKAGMEKVSHEAQHPDLDKLEEDGKPSGHTKPADGTSAGPGDCCQAASGALPQPHSQSDQ